MIGFIIKKAFFDAWDNLLRFFLYNFLTFPFLALGYFGLNVVLFHGLIGYFIVFLALTMLIIHQGTIAYIVRDIGDSISTSLKSYIKYLKMDFKIKLQFGLSWSLFIVIATYAIMYYLSRRSLVSIVPAIAIFWFALTTLMATIMFFPIKIRLEGNFRKVLKKCYLLLLDNPLTGILVFIYVLFLLAVSALSLGLLPPGLSAITCVLDTAVHLYELKYDYLEKNPDADKKNLPWREITWDLNENIGPRTIKNTIFPWKD